MAEFKLIDAKMHHCGLMLRRLREGHKEAVASLGFNAHRELRDRFEASHFAKAWLIDGRIAALGGMVGQAASSQGFIWLALSEEAVKHPIPVVREARRQLDFLMQIRHELITNIVTEDDKSLKFAMYLGFELIHHAKVQIGSGQVIAMRYTRKLARAA